MINATYRLGPAVGGGADRTHAFGKAAFHPIMRRA